MEKLFFPPHIRDKIFQIEFELNTSTVSKITTYFPFTQSEKQEILEIIKNNSFAEFHSIFSDLITDEEWSKTKQQIKVKFQNELFNIDNIS